MMFACFVLGCYTFPGNIAKTWNSTISTVKNATFAAGDLFTKTNRPLSHNFQHSAVVSLGQGSHSIDRLDGSDMFWKVKEFMLCTLLDHASCL